MRHIKLKKDKSKFRMGPFIVIMCILFIVTYYFLHDYATYGKTHESVVRIAGHINNRGDIVDWSNEIGVYSVDDIKLFMDKYKVTIQYGKLVLNWKKRDFLKDETLADLDSIMIKVFQDEETGMIYLKWKDQNVERWVR